MHSYVLSFSSEQYPLALKDVANLPDSTLPFESQNEVIILLGGNRLVQEDCLLAGRSKIQKALKNGEKVIPTRVAFPVPAHIGALFALIKKVRYRWKTNGTGIYHIDPNFLRNSGLERFRRNAENAYQFSSRRWKMKPTQQHDRYNKLVENISHGYDDSCPMRVMLCRKGGKKDSLDDGHHRLSICIDQHVPFITTRFCYASSWQAVRQILSFSKRYRYKTK